MLFKCSIFYYLFKNVILNLILGFIKFVEIYLIMQTASFSGFLETVLYILAFYYIFKFLARLFLPIMLKKVVEKAGANFQQQYQSYGPQNTTSSNKDEVAFDKAKSDKPRETKKVGEYVDYEEID